MKTKRQTEKSPGMSDAAVRGRTGKTWPEWFAILNKAGAPKMSHKEIAAYLHEKQGIPGWWAQMVTVGYERAHGRRELHQKPGGYEISASRTVGAPLAALFKAWQDEKTRRRWLPETIVVRKATANRSLRITWADGKTSLSVNFYPKGAKSQVVVQHGKLPDAKAAEQMKTYWAKTLDRFQERVEA